MVEDESGNYLFDLAEKFILNTARSIFLTGKAGTGKTTFLRKIRGITTKNVVVVAPTGVAAVNAGGTTVHSFFQLPFTPFVPQAAWRSSRALQDRYSLLQNLRIDAEKRELFRAMELLIIDEVSMVRADLLDCIDVVLRHFRRKPNIPFGGVQVLLIGDLFQLPPVVQQQDWNILRQFYNSPFFFDSNVIAELQPLYIELKKIYRQRDEKFIDVLNNVRNNVVTGMDLALLNERYHPDFSPANESQYVTLTTHNYKADKINNEELSRLKTPLRTFDGLIEGDFSERAFPTDKILMLKEGAQIMFLRNDTERIRRYYNGKVGTITKILDDRIFVELPGEAGELEVTKETWTNVRYSFNYDTRQIEEEVMGTFTQFAIRLAWAITIHKSQGLTFERIIIDAADSFAPGQVYVALSRCTSLQGLVLKSRILRSAIRTDERVLEFSKRELPANDLRPMLDEEQKQHAVLGVMKVFEPTLLFDQIIVLRQAVAKSTVIDQESAVDLLDRVDYLLNKLDDVAEKFGAQLRGLVTNRDYLAVRTRLEQAIEYYLNETHDSILLPLSSYRDELKKTKKAVKVKKQLRTLIELVESYRSILTRTLPLVESLANRLDSQMQGDDQYSAAPMS
jgi:hypothetical protein